MSDNRSRCPPYIKKILTFFRASVKIYIGAVFAIAGIHGKGLRKGVADVRDVFPKLYGNAVTKSRLGAAIQNGTLPHAFLIDGEAGSGKMTLALEIAAALNCENKDAHAHSLPCYNSNNCKRILGGGHVDVHVLERADGRATIGVQEIKDMRSDMFLSSTESDYKIYIVRDTERTIRSAFCASGVILSVSLTMYIL